MGDVMFRGNRLTLRNSIGLALVAWTSALYVQATDLRFENISGEEGLSQSVVTAMVQDAIGYLWIGTQDGLNRYDGYDFQVFKNKLGDPSSLPANHVLSLLITADQQLWVGLVDGGLARFNPRQATFNRYGPLSKSPRGLTGSTITAIYEDSTGQLWVASLANGLFRYDSRQDQFLPFGPLADTAVWTMAETSDGQLLAGADRGLLIIDATNNQVKKAPFFTQNTLIRDLLFDPAERLWIATRRDGLWVCDIAADRTDQVPHEPNQFNRITDHQIRRILIDHNNFVWVATHRGLNRAKWSTAPVQSFKWDRYRHNPSERNGLGSDFVNSLFQDHANVLWIGVAGRGLDKLTPVAASFGLHKPNNNSRSDINGAIIFSMLEDSDGTRWIGSYNRGLDRIDGQTGTVTNYRHNPLNPESIPDDAVKALIRDGEGKLWLGTENNGIARWQQSSQTFIHYPANPPSALQSPDINTLFVDRQNQLWAGTNQGLHRYDAVDDAFQVVNHADWPSFSELAVYHIDEADDGSLFLATNNGLWHWSPAGVRHFNSSGTLPTPSINAVYVANPNTLWLGTDIGLVRVERPMEPSPIITTYTEAAGLANDTVYGVLPDAEGQLWLSTNHGLSRFDPRREHFDNFDATAGLQDNEFNQGAFYRSQGGRLYFGGINGFNAFHPQQIDIDRTPPPLALTGFSKFNKPVALAQPLHLLDQLTLDHRDSVVSFQFAAFHFVNPGQIRYAYRLDGFDTDWTYTQGRREVTYTNLDPGNYTLRVKAAIQGGSWNEQGIQLPIRVVPIFWKTPLAYVLYICFIAACVLTVHRLRVRNLDRRQRHLTQVVAAKTHELIEKNQLLEEKNSLLRDRNQELETLDETVKAINREESLEKLCSALLEEGMRLCPAADRGAILVLDEKDGFYRIAAAKNHDPAVLKRFKLPAATAEPRYGDDAETLATDIFLVPNRPPIAELGEHSSTGRHMLTVAIRYASRVAGFLVLENEGDATELADNAAKLERFRQHATSALAKARHLEALLETTARLKATRGELLEAAHLAGMAEIATTVLHNVGNTLNSVKVSSQMLQERLENSQTHRVFLRMIQLLRDNADDLNTFIETTDKGRKVPEAMLKIGELLLEDHCDQTDEVQRLIQSVETIQDVVAAQSMHTEQVGLVEDLDINLLLEHMLTVNKDTFQRLKIKISTEFATLPQIRIDKTKLVYMVTNLLNNACDALSQNSGERHLNIRTAPMDQDFVQVHVIDNGIGIDRQYLDRLFKMGFTTKRRGHGFGLHYCANTIKRMGGGIKVESPGVGKGAHSMLWFPIRRGSEAAVDERASA